MDKEMNQQELAEELKKHCELKGNSWREWLGMIMELLNQFCYIGTGVILKYWRKYLNV